MWLNLTKDNNHESNLQSAILQALHWCSSWKAHNNSPYLRYNACYCSIFWLLIGVYMCRKKNKMTGLYIKMVCNSILTNGSTYIKKTFSHFRKFSPFTLVSSWNIVFLHPVNGWIVWMMIVNSHKVYVIRKSALENVSLHTAALRPRHACQSTACSSKPLL